MKILLTVTLLFTFYSCGGGKGETISNNNSTNINTCQGGHCNYTETNNTADNESRINNIINNATPELTQNTEEIVEVIMSEEFGTGEEESHEEVEHEFSETSQVSHDLEGIGARVEQKRIENVTDGLMSRFELSADRAQSVAKLMVNFKSIQNDRSLTSADREYFTESLLGVSDKEVKEVIQRQIEGDEESYSDFIEGAAIHNGVTPEHMNAIIEELI